MKEFSDSLPAFELEHVLTSSSCLIIVVNTFLSLTRQQQFPIFFTSSLFSLKIDKKTGIKA